jgi:hypothetical protein
LRDGILIEGETVMALQEMIVVEKQGTSGPTAEYPYQFYAKVNERETETKVVNILMPVGGKESGLYRFPRPRECVMVDDGDGTGTYYLIGYLPNARKQESNFLSNAAPVEGEDGYDTKQENFDAERAALLDAKALVLRYEQTGKKVPEDGKDERYSEIGFYRKETQWPTTSKTDYKSVPPERSEDESDEAYSERLVIADFPRNTGEAAADHIKRVTPETPETPVFPKIDRLNIQSSGDMRAVAKNYQLLKAKRFELLVNTSDTIHDQKELARDDLPLGDNPGDDSTLHAGDAHIRARNRVVIKAGEEIILQVGKTAVKISDGALDVISKMVDSNFTNAYDTTFSMSGSDGISMYGRNVKINSEISLDLGDTYGGSFSSALGVVSIGGREIKAAGYDSVRYGLLVGNAAARYIQAISAGSMGAAKADDTWQYIHAYIKFTTNLLIHGAQLIAKIVDAYKTIKKYHDMGKGLRKEKEEEEAKAKEEMAKNKKDKADAKETEAKKDMDAAKQTVTGAKTDCKNKTDAYNQAKKDYAAAAPGPDKDAKRDAMNNAYKDLEKSYQDLSRAEDDEREKTKAHVDSVKSKDIAQADYERAHAKYEKAQKETVSAWSSEIKKKTGATPAPAAPTTPAPAPTPPPSTPPTPPPSVPPTPPPSVPPTPPPSVPPTPPPSVPNP